MRKIIVLSYFCLLAVVDPLHAQQPCSADSVRGLFDFWIGSWDVYNSNEQLVGRSEVYPVLHSCAVVEDWESGYIRQAFVYAGKGFSTYNTQTKQWQQIWVDNAGNTTLYLKGRKENNKMLFWTEPFVHNADTTIVKKLSYEYLNPFLIKQNAEISYNNGQTWQTEYSLQYRRHVDADEMLIRDRFRQMDSLFALNRVELLSAFYTADAKLISYKQEIIGQKAIHNYWLSLKNRCVDIKHDIHTIDVKSPLAVEAGLATIVYLSSDKTKHETIQSRYVLIWRKDPDNIWRIQQEQHSER
ncbi:MAG: nuclear transport factor 2 family protein [Cytophagales bacterium]|nr:MAG: nuclear transport factor 2 family protein [Cytophagales bacterium]TAF59258.1 MAG: nuclear transport factor 2 family protein [Cytophagales bacterium]